MSLPIHNVFVGDIGVAAVNADAVATVKAWPGLQLLHPAFSAAAFRAGNHGFSSQMIFM
jgi:hypothetical protein